MDNLRLVSVVCKGLDSEGQIKMIVACCCRCIILGGKGTATTEQCYFLYIRHHVIIQHNTVWFRSQCWHNENNTDDTLFFWVSSSWLHLSNMNPFPPVLLNDGTLGSITTKKNRSSLLRHPSFLWLLGKAFGLSSLPDARLRTCVGLNMTSNTSKLRTEKTKEADKEVINLYYASYLATAVLLDILRGEEVSKVTGQVA